MARWEEIVGAEFVHAGTPAEAVDGIVPAAVLRPGDVEVLRRIVREGAPLVASGFGAHLDIGSPPRALSVLVRLDRLDRVIAHEAGDMTLTVEAGCPLPVIERLLARAGQWLPLDPPHPDRTTAGGLIAANLAGPLRASQGTVRDLLLGLRVVEADGALVTSGGKVVKNVAGYDLPKLHVGALGTLGVIVEATFKLRPRPAGEAAVVVPCRSASEANEVALEVRDRLDPLWLEIGGAGVEATGDPPAVLFVGLAGIPDEVAEARDRASAVADRHGLDTRVVGDGAALRRRLGAFEVGPYAAVLKAAALPSQVGTVIEEAERVARALGARIRCLAHAANGMVRIGVVEPAHVAPLVDRLRPEREAHGGSLVVARARPEVKAGLSIWGSLGAGAGLMARITAAADPRGILAPGRLLERDDASGAPNDPAHLAASVT